MTKRPERLSGVRLEELRIRVTRTQDGHFHMEEVHDLGLVIDELLAYRAARQPGMGAAREDDLRWFIEREAVSGQPGCLQTCPARAQCPVGDDAQAEVTDTQCRAALLAHFGLAPEPGKEREP